MKVSPMNDKIKAQLNKLETIIAHANALKTVLEEQQRNGAERVAPYVSIAIHNAEYQINQARELVES